MWHIEKEQGVPIYITIMELILSYIKEGKLLPGECLPSERKLASFFEVNRSTVVHALDELVSLGWIIRKQGSGTIINQGKWGITTVPKTDWRRYLEQNAFSQNDPVRNKIEESLKTHSQDTIDAYTGELPMDLIPSFDFPALTWKHFLEEEQQDDLGYYPLRQAIIKSIKNEYQLNLSADSLLITSGAQQALFLILQVLLKPGDSVAIEDPSFLYALPLFQAAGIRLYGVKMDTEGICIHSLEKVIRQRHVKMIMVNPSFQNPTGKVMTLERRKALIAICQNYQVPILEDDVFANLHFHSSNLIEPLKKLDPENVLYIGSLSKILGSTTKIGWLSAPTSVSQKLAEARKMMDFSLSIFPQLLANLALNDPTFPTKITALRKRLSKKAEAVYSVLADSEEWEVEKPKGGFYLWAVWKNGDFRQKEWDLFIKEDLLIAPSILFSEQRNGIRINFSRINDKNIELFSIKFKEITRKITLSQI